MINSAAALKKLESVSSSMAIEDIFLPKEFIEKMSRLADGKISMDEVIFQLNEEYNHG